MGSLPFIATMFGDKESASVRFFLVTGVVAIVAFAWVLIRWGLPMALLCGLIFITNSAYADPAFLPRLPIAGGNIFLSDLYLGLSLTVIFFSKRWTSVKNYFSYWKHLSVFAGVIGVSIAVAAHGGAEMRYVLRELHPIVYYPFTIFVVLYASQGRDAVRRIITCLTVAIIVSVVATFWQMALLDRFKFMTYAEPVFDLSGKVLDAVRVRPQSQWLFLTFFVGSLGSYSIWRKGRPLMLALLVLVSAALFVGYSRTYLLGLGTGLAAIVYVRSSHWKVQMRTVSLSIAVILAAVFLVDLAAQKLAPQYREAFQSRIVASVSTAALEDSNSVWEFGSRLYEMETGIGHIAQHPVLGIGVGAVYREVLPFEYLQTEVSENSDSVVHYMHNTYLYIWLKYGILGVVALLWILRHFLKRLTELARSGGPEGPLFMGIFAAFCALAGCNLVSPSFIDPPAGATLVGLMAGLVDVRCSKLERVNANANWAENGRLVIPRRSGGSSIVGQRSAF